MRSKFIAVRWLCWLLLLLISPAVSVCAAGKLGGDVEVHDPSSIIECKDRYYVFGTGRGIISRSSADKTTWVAGPRVFTNGPAWTREAVPGANDVFWAPDVICWNGEYRLYYSVSTWGSQDSAIGLATTPTLDPDDPRYAWNDRGIVIRSRRGDPYNTIDPSATVDAQGNLWLVFGSYWTGIYLVQLDKETGLRISADSPTHRLAWNSSIEASCIMRRGNFYYLFVNWGSCCTGVNSTYNIRVGRSRNITGPYLDRSGADMVEGGGTLFLEGTGNFTGPGHFAVLNDTGREWFSYHYYDAAEWHHRYHALGAPKFDLEPLTWTADQWPAFTNDWSAVYTFRSGARDENGGFGEGLLLGGASLQDDPSYGKVLDLNGSNQWAQLPAGVGFARTFTALVNWKGGARWQRIFDFGVDTSRYVMLTPASGEGKLRCDIRANGVTESIEAPASLPKGSWSHVALTFDGPTGILYVNGSPVATNSAMALSPLHTCPQTNYIGRSHFRADPYFSGRIANLRAYGRVLSAREIAGLDTVERVSRPR